MCIRDSDAQSVLRIAVDRAHVDEHLAVVVQITEFLCNLSDLLHAASADCDLSSETCGDVQNLLEAADVGGKGCNDDTLVTVLKEILQRLTDKDVYKRQPPHSAIMTVCGEENTMRAACTGCEMGKTPMAANSIVYAVMVRES